MAVEGFLKIPGIRGASTLRGREDEIEVHEVNFGFSTQVSAATTRQRARILYRPLMLTKFCDQSSHNLQQALAQHLAWKEAVLTLTEPQQGESGSGAPENYLVVTLKELTPTAYTLTGSSRFVVNGRS